MITVDMTKAKVIAHDARRAARNAAFAPLDIKATIPAESEAAEAARATIRTNDAALQVSMDAASDADTLKALMPAGDQTMTKSATRVAADKVTFTQAEVTSAVALKAPIATPVFTGDATVSTGNLVIGTNGKGIDFSANADSSATGASTTSELLDDYEEGTWTPAFGRNGGTQPTPTYGEQVGSYTKVGNMVFLTGDMYISAISIPDNGNLVITGMPFTKGSGHNPTGSFTSTGFNFSKARSQLVWLDGTKLGFLGQAASTGAGAWNWEELAALDGGEALRFAITYQV